MFPPTGWKDKMLNKIFKLKENNTAVATVSGSVLGASTVASYIESAAGVSA